MAVWRTADAVNQLLRYPVVNRARLVVFEALVVIDKAGSQHIGIAVIEVVKNLADILAYGHFQFNAEIAGELLGELVIKPVRLIIYTGIRQRGRNSAYAKFAPRLDGRNAVVGFAEPGDRRPQGRCQQQGDDADKQIINLKFFQLVNSLRRTMPQ